MLNLQNTTTDKLQLVTSAVATVDVHASYADLVSGTVTPSRQNTAISTAATTDIVATPGTTGAIRNVKTLHIRNKDATVSTDVTALYNANGSTFELHRATLVPGATLEYVEGVGFYTITAATSNLTLESVSAQSGFAADTYLTGSNISVPSNLPVVGTAYRLVFDVTKTGVGVGAPTVIVRFGPNGSTADGARCTFAFGAGTAAADTAIVECICVFRTVGASTSAVLQGVSRAAKNLLSTGWSTSIWTVLSTSSGFDSTVANAIIGASYNGGASAVHTIQLVRAELIA